MKKKKTKCWKKPRKCQLNSNEKSEKMNEER